MASWIESAAEISPLPPPGLRVFANSDSEMRRFESSRLSLTHTESGCARNATKWQWDLYPANDPKAPCFVHIQ